MLIAWGLIDCFCLDGTGYDLKLFFSIILEIKFRFETGL